MQSDDEDVELEENVFYISSIPSKLILRLTFSQHIRSTSKVFLSGSRLTRPLFLDVGGYVSAYLLLLDLFEVLGAENRLPYQLTNNELFKTYDRVALILYPRPTLISFKSFQLP